MNTLYNIGLILLIVSIFYIVNHDFKTKSKEMEKRYNEIKDKQNE